MGWDVFGWDVVMSQRRVVVDGTKAVRGEDRVERAKCSEAKYNTTQHNTAQHSTATMEYNVSCTALSRE